MKQINFLWKGPSGFNPLCGYVVNNEPVTIRDDVIKKRLLSACLIQPIAKTNKEEVENAGREKEAGETVEDGS